MQTEQSQQGGVAGAAHQAASEVADKAHELGEKAAEQTRAARGQAASRMREQVDQRTAQAAEQADSMVQVARRVGQELRQQGSESQARLADQAADRVEQLGDYLRRADANRLMADIESFGRRQPMVMAAGGLVAGLLAARFLKASSSSRTASRGSVGSERDVESHYAEWDRDLPESAQLPPTRAGLAATPATPAAPTTGGW